MLTSPIKSTSEYKRLLAGVSGQGALATALFGMPPTSRAQVVAALVEDTKRPALVVCAGEADATRFAEDLAFFGAKAAVYPARDYVLRSVEGQNRACEYRRLAVSGDLVGGRLNAVCAPVEAVLQYTLPRAELCANTLTVRPGMQIPLHALLERLARAGYLRRFQVEGPGQFSVRGGIVDIYAPDMEKPCRLEFWGDGSAFAENLPLPRAGSAAGRRGGGRAAHPHRAGQRKARICQALCAGRGKGFGGAGRGQHPFRDG